MDFRKLTDAECGGTNPVLQLTSHLTKDNTFRDSHLFQTFSSDADQLVEQFLQETRAVPQAFQMDGLLQEMREIESQRFAMPPVPASRVKDHLNDDIWAQQYLQDGKKFEPRANQEEIWTQYRQERNPDEMHEFGLGEEWARGYLEQVNNNLSDEALEVQEAANELLNSIDDQKFAYSKFMKFMNQVGDGRVIIEGGNVVGEVEETSNEWAQEFAENNMFESTYQTVRGTKEENADYLWSKFHEEWKKLSDKDLGSDHPWLSEYANFTDPYQEYAFSETNPMSNINNPLKVGKEKLANGDLPGAVLCFEAAVKQQPNNSEAWQLLGVTQAENEQDPNAICALKRCLQLDPTNATAILSLAVCYTNENYHNQACQALANWLKCNPKYSNLVPLNYDFSESVPPFLSHEKHKEVETMFIKAVQMNPTEVDYEVQCCLGVLFNLSGEYDKAVDCFKTALQVKPDDSRLWNRLGATLANSNRSEEAVDAYHNALQLSPGFIRARYNIGITCISLGAYREAAEHFLTALNQQARGRDMENLQSVSQMSEGIWSTLKMSVGLMNRPDLKDLVAKRDLNQLNVAFDMTDS